MKIITLEDLVGNADHMLWWLVHRPSFAPNVLSCAADAYEHWDAIPKDVRFAAAGTRRYSVLVQNLRAMLIREFQAVCKPMHGQARFKIAGPNSEVLCAVRKCEPVDGGFTTDKIGTAVEQLSFVTRSSFEFEPGIPSTVGMLLIHCATPKKENHVTVWLAHEWQAKKGSRFVRCKECAHLGDWPYKKAENDRNTTGDTVEDL